MKLGGKCRVCGKSCDDFFLQNGRMLCNKCFIKLANKHLHYRLKMQKINAILMKYFIVALIAFAFVCGVAVGLFV